MANSVTDDAFGEGRDVDGRPLPSYAVSRLGTTSYRAPKGVECARLSPDGSRVAISVDDACNTDLNSVLIYDAFAGLRIQTLSRHEHPIHCIDYARDGAGIVSGGTDGAIRIWDVATGSASRTLRGAFEAAFAVAYSEDNRWVISTHEEGAVRVWDLSTGNETAWLRPTQDYPSSYLIALSSDGRTLATDDMDNIVLWRLPQTTPIGFLKGHEYAVESLAFSPDGKTLASGSLDESVRLWDVEAQRERHVLRGHASSVHAIAYSPDGSLLASGGDDADVLLWNTADNSIVRRLPGHVGTIESLSFSRDSSLLVSAGAGRTIRVWDLRTFKCLLPDIGHTHSIQGIEFSVNDDRVITASLDGTVRAWDPDTGREASRFLAHGRGVAAMSLSADSPVMATVEQEDNREERPPMATWDMASGTRLSRFTGQRGTPVCFGMGPGPIQLMTLQSRTGLFLWDTATGELVRRWRPRAALNAFALSPNRELIAACEHENGDVYLIDARTFEPLQKVQADPDGWLGALAFSPDGRLLAVAAADNEVSIRDAATLERTAAVGGAIGIVDALAWSRDGRFLATGSDDNTVRIWDPSSGKELIVLRGHEDGVKHLAFSHDDSKLASASLETSALVWDFARIKKDISAR